MTLNDRLLHRIALGAVTKGVALAVLSMGLTCAHAEAPAAKSATAPYKGRFASECVEMVPGKLSFIDTLTLTPVNDKTVSVGMNKEFYTTEDCKKGTHIGQVQVPTGTWVFEGQVKIGDRMTDRVNVILPAGTIKVLGKPGPKGNGRIRTKGNEIEVVVGKKDNLIISNQSAASEDKSLRWIGPDGKLLMGDPTQAGADGYPGALEEALFFKKQ
jgi:hypothetical protein